MDAELMSILGGNGGGGGGGGNKALGGASKAGAVPLAAGEPDQGGGWPALLPRREGEEHLGPRLGRRGEADGGGEQHGRGDPPGPPVLRPGAQEHPGGPPQGAGPPHGGGHQNPASQQGAGGGAQDAGDQARGGLQDHAAEQRPGDLPHRGDYKQGGGQGRDCACLHSQTFSQWRT